jgi:putative transposase
MRDYLILAVHLLVTFAKLLRLGGVRAVVAESLLLKHQLLITARCRRRAPNLTTSDRFVIGLTSLFVNPHRIPKLSAILKPVTLFKFHKALINRKYRLLFSASGKRGKPGPKGPSAELIAAIVEMKRRNPRFGYVRIAQQISHAFGIVIDKDVVRRVLAKHYRPEPGADGTSWLSLLAHAKDSLWSVDMFRVESILLRSYWVMLVMDVFTRRIVGFGVEPANIDGISVCRMFNRATAGQPKPKRVSTDHDPLFRFHRWLATLRVLEIDEIKSIPYVPVSHPFVERLIGTIRREYLDCMFFWNAVDLPRKFGRFPNLLQRRSMPSVPKRRHAGGKIWQAGATVRFTWTVRLAATLPRPFSNADCGVAANSPRTRDMRVTERNSSRRASISTSCHRRGSTRRKGSCSPACRWGGCTPRPPSSIARWCSSGR